MELELPELEGECYLLDVLFDVGPCMPSGMGPLPLGYEQLQAWQRQMGVELTPWEARTVQRLSRAYCGELAAAANPDAAAPGSADESPEHAEERRERVAGRLGDSLRMLRDTRPKR
ncbi:hypothetical protein [Comamonas terrigena]|uniref:hypothetical protein n=1 Tax=Comamonas terrigena TaxID=32013 RepID=UPI0024479898|nr:hypothetical protein [Comamonas terrigena]MDH1700272.1 hypothetical protein [Comamonas terrigena]